MYTIVDLQEKAKNDLAKIGVDLEKMQSEHRVAFTSDRRWPSTAYMHLFIQNGIIHVNFYGDRGGLEEELQTTDIDDALYHVYSDRIFNMASTYAVKTCRPGEDDRRYLFAKELELFRMIDEKYYLRAKKEIEETLKQSPYHDER